GVGHMGTAGPPCPAGAIPLEAVGLAPPLPLAAVGVLLTAAPSEEKAWLTSMGDLRPMAATPVTSSSARTAPPGATRRRAPPLRPRALAGDCTMPLPRGARRTSFGEMAGAGGRPVQVKAGAVRDVAASGLATAGPARSAPRLLVATRVLFVPVAA